jgi:hypothetical protein
VTATTTVTQPAQTSTATTVAVVPTSTTGSESGDGGLPWWGWLLIAVGVVAIGFGIYRLGRRREHGVAAGDDVLPPSPPLGDAPASPPAEEPPHAPRP